MKWDQPCFEGACNHGLQKNPTVKKAAQVNKKAQEKPIPVEGLPKLGHN